MGKDAVGSENRSLPQGTVTFLFTDIEGSTKLLHRLGERYGHVLARHRALLRGAFERGGGYEVDTQGDAFFVAFPTASGAVEAAVESQKILHREGWEHGGHVRVRMGIHTGHPLVVDNSYVGMDVHRAARICSVSHGAQIVVSATVRKQLGEKPAYGFKDLGHHRLKDLEETEHLLQIVVDELPSNFPQLRSVTPPTNVPRHVASLVGRETELANLRRLLVEEGTRLITVTGPGGTGKTRLASAAALSSLDHFTDGVFFVDLTEVTTSDVLVAAISETLGVSASDDARSGIEGHIGSKQMLILLDNFEQVIVAADVVTSLLHCCPKLQVLTTSRITLSVNGELEFSVDPLGLPNERTSRAVLASEAGQLFATRARAVKPGFAVTEENAASVAEICEVLDGLPLALELAAARLKLFPVDALLERLEDRLKLLTGGSSDSPTRHRTLRGTIEWSYDLLEAQERDFFRALAIFNGGATLEAIEEIVPSNLEAVDALTSLVNHSLIRQNELPDGGFRFSLLQTIRQFAAELLEEDPDRDALRIAHAEYYLKSLRAARKTNLDRDSDLVSRDLDNFRASLSWFEGRAEDSPPDQEALLELTGMLGQFWYMRGLVDEGSRWLASSLQYSAREARPSRALALRQLGVLKELHRNVDEARALFDEALDLYRTLGDELGQAACLNSIGVVVMAQGNLEAAEDFFTSSLEIRKRIGNDQAVGSLSNLGVLHVHRGDPQRAAQFLEEALDLDIAAGDEWGAAVTHNNLANAYLANGEVDRSVAMVTLGMEGCYKVEEYDGLCDAFETTALLAFEQGDALRAARILGAGQNLRDRIAIDPTMLDSKWIEAGTEKVKGALGREAFESLHSEGAQMTLEQSVNYALGRHQDLTEIVTRGEP